MWICVHVWRKIPGQKRSLVERGPIPGRAPTETMSDVPKIVYDRLRAASLDEAHPDADLLIALVEQSLSGVEREDVLRHLARCGDCREIAALGIAPSPEQEVQPEAPDR